MEPAAADAFQPPGGLGGSSPHGAGPPAAGDQAPLIRLPVAPLRGIPAARARDALSEGEDDQPLSARSLHGRAEARVSRQLRLLGKAGVALVVAALTATAAVYLGRSPGVSGVELGKDSNCVEFSVPIIQKNELGSLEPRRLAVKIHLPPPVSILPPFREERQEARQERQERRQERRQETQGRVMHMMETLHELRNPRQESVFIDFESVGCFPKAPGDMLQEEQKFFALTCVKAEGSTPENPCRSGLPFYRKLLQAEETHLDCFTFCTSKGMDLFGVLATIAEKYQKLGFKQECRCGATEDNYAIWHGKPDRRKMLDMSSMVPKTSKQCYMKVWKYSGYMIMKQIPFAMLFLSILDEAYEDSIVHGRMMLQQMEDRPVEEPLKPVDIPARRRLGLCEDSATTPIEIGGRPASCQDLRSYCSANSNVGTITRDSCPLTCGVCSPQGGWVPCYPYQCAGGPPWTTKASDGNVYIRYYFCSNINEERKMALRDAVGEWAAKTCIRFMEQDENAPRPRLRICVTNYDSCDATVGYPGDNGEAVLNPGWCDSTTHVGSIIHELGHIIGMNHEQSRMDAAQRYRTPAGVKGNYLNVFWQNIPATWQPQYTGREDTYVGSTDEGANDAHAGYSEYDYESIMHYGRIAPGTNQIAFETVNPLFNDVVGQRAGLSEGDMRKTGDMYQCPYGRNGRSPTPAPTPAPTPRPTPPPPTTQPTVRPTPPPTQPPPPGCTDTDPPGWQCNGGPCTCEQLRGYCDHPYYGRDVSNYCPATCDNCGFCKDEAPRGWDCNGAPCTCEVLRGFCNDPVYGPGVSSSCRATCGTCPR